MLRLRNKETSDIELNERNVKFDYFMDQIFPGQIVAGRPRNPCVIYKNELLSCYIRKNILKLLDKSEAGNIIFECDITKEPDIEKILYWYKAVEHSKMYRIKVIGLDLFLCGNSKYDSTPVFGKYYNHYKTKNYAQDIIDKFSLDFCEII